MSDPQRSEEDHVRWLWPDGSITGTGEVWGWEMWLAEEAEKRWTRRFRRWLAAQIGRPGGPDGR